ncbi:MAG: glycosyltransferase family 4 protein [Candidatus Thorarchaeota archaeon]
MHIIHITDDFPPHIGGMATHAWELSKALAGLGHSVTVLTAAKVRYAEPRFALPGKETLNGVKIVNFGYPLGCRRYYDVFFDLLIRRYLRRSERQPSGVVLHLHEHMRPLSLRKLSRLPLVWTNHSSMFLKDCDNQTRRPALTQMVQCCDWITAPSRELCTKAIALDYPAERVTYIPNGVDTDRFVRNGVQDERRLTIGDTILRLPRGRCVVLCARRFTHKNGLHTYLDALESIPNETISKCVFLFAGNKPSQDGHYGQEISARISSLSSRADIHLLGPVPNDTMPQVCGVADIGVLPSLKEATSITGLEAMAAGLPIVGTDVGGIPEIVEHGGNGLLCPPEDAASLVTNLSRLINDPDLRVEMGLQGRRRAEQEFSWKKIAEQFVQIYRRASR